MNDKSLLNPDTYARVQRAMRDLGYDRRRRPSAAARVRSVAVVLPAILDPFFSVLLHGIDAAAKTYSYNLLFFDSNNSPEIELKNITRIAGSSAAGVVLVPSGDSPRGYAQLREAGIPVVLLDRILSAEDPSYVISNDEEGAYLATKYLMDLGHRAILYMGGNSNTSTEKARLAGYTRALREAALPVRRQLVTECSFDSESSYRAMKKILRGRHLGFSAAFAGNDLIAFGIRKALEESELRVPEDISLVGYGDMPFASLISLTTVSCPAYEMAQDAMLLLIHIIEKKFVSSRRIVLRPTLVLRSSCRQLSDRRGPDPRGGPHHVRAAARAVLAKEGE
jgi:LacI family transcriptional regulator